MLKFCKETVLLIRRSSGRVLVVFLIMGGMGLSCRSSESSISSSTQPPEAISPTGLQTTQVSHLSNSLKVNSTIQSDWQTGFCVSFRVSNPGIVRSGNWRLAFSMPQAEINQSWNGGFVREGGKYIANPPDWAQVIQPGQAVDLGFCANKRGSDYQPRDVMVTVL